VAQAQAVAALFQQANWDWNNPLSASAFEQWRDRQVRKSDEVKAVQNPQSPSEHLTQIRTTAAEGEVEAASITLDTDDYDAVSERLEFRDREWVELSEISEVPTESASGSGASTTGVPVRAAEIPSRPAAFAPGSSASISDELQVLSALNSIEADLGVGELEDVTLTDGKVLVRGPGSIPQQRQEEIRSSLAKLPHVEVEFTSLPPVSAPSEVAAVNGSAAGAAGSPMETRLEKRLGGHAEFERFSTQLIDLDDAAMKRVYALHNLAQKFSPDAEAKLSSQDLSLLHELSRKHTAVLAEKVSGMERMLVPALSSLGGTAGSVRPAVHAAWQPAAEDVYGSARRVDVLVAQMLGMTPGVAPGAVSTSALPSELLAALKDLEANVAACDHFLQAR